MLAGLFPAGSTSASGRAAGTDPMTTLRAAARPRAGAPDDFPEQLAELLAYFEDSFPRTIPSAGWPAPARAARAPEPWLLGSSPQSAIWAARARPAVRVRRLHQPGRRARSRDCTARGSTAERALPAPRTAVAAWVLCADTDEEAQHLATSSRMTFTLLRRGPADPRAAAREGRRFFAREGASAVGRAPGVAPSSARPRRCGPASRSSPPSTAPRR